MLVQIVKLSFRLPVAMMLILMLSCGNGIEMDSERNRRQLEEMPGESRTSPRSCSIHGAVRAPACIYSFKEAVQANELTTAVIVGGWLGERAGKKALFESRVDMELSRASSIELTGLECTSYRAYPDLFLGRLVRIVGYMRVQDNCGEDDFCQRVLDVKAIDYVMGNERSGSIEEDVAN